MWSGNAAEFASKHGITPNQAKRFECTGEHLKARQNGGTAARSNIVAACRYCNQRRHRRKVALSPDRYKGLVRERINLGRWHPLWASKLV
ncbi:MAG: HNH endonuclease [Candidatus Competibacteraceae bacterium]